MRLRMAAQIDPEALNRLKKTAQEEKLVTLRDDSARPPATISTSSMHGILFGPGAGQPSKASEDIKPGWGKVLIRIVFWTWGALVMVRLLFWVLS